MLFSELVKMLDGKVSKLEDRIVLHKKIYFLQEVFKALFLPKGAYTFFMYRYGPYSQVLASDVMAWFYKSEDFEVEVDEAKMRLFSEFSSEFGSEVKKWEMAASIHFLRSQGLEKEVVFARVSKKPYLADRELFETVWKILEGL